MGHESILYGCIQGVYWGYDRSGCQRPEQVNRQVIESLPQEDSWPFLTRAMFALSGEGPLLGTYRTQIIHLGASFKGVEDEWEEWLDKWEHLLRRMFWYRADLHLQTEFMEELHYIWCVPSDQQRLFWTESPQVVTQWEFSGGPRNFWSR